MRKRNRKLISEESGCRISGFLFELTANPAVWGQVLHNPFSLQAQFRLQQSQRRNSSTRSSRWRSLPPAPPYQGFLLHFLWVHNSPTCDHCTLQQSANISGLEEIGHSQLCFTFCCLSPFQCCAWQSSCSSVWHGAGWWQRWSWKLRGSY